MHVPRRVILIIAALIFAALIAWLMLPRFSRDQYDARTMSSRTVSGYSLPFGNEIVTRITQDPEPEMLRILREQRGIIPIPEWETGCTRYTWGGVGCSFQSRCASDFMYINAYTAAIGLTDPDELLTLYQIAMRVADSERDQPRIEVELMMDYEHDSAIWCLVDNELVVLWERNLGDAAHEMQAQYP